MFRFECFRIDPGRCSRDGEPPVDSCPTLQGYTLSLSSRVPSGQTEAAAGDTLGILGRNPGRDLVGIDRRCAPQEIGQISQVWTCRSHLGSATTYSVGGVTRGADSGQLQLVLHYGKSLCSFATRSERMAERQSYGTTSGRRRTARSSMMMRSHLCCQTRSRTSSCLA